MNNKFYADLLVFDSVIVEIKAKRELTNADMAQTINYLKCSGCKVGIVLNFGTERLGMKRIAF